MDKAIINIQNKNFALQEKMSSEDARNIMLDEMIDWYVANGNAITALEMKWRRFLTPGYMA